MSLRRIVILGPRSGRRVDALVAAAARRDVPVVAIGYDALAADPGCLAAHLGRGTLLRFESPDENPAAFRALYLAGAVRAEREGCTILGGAELAAACGGDGIGSPTQLAYGIEALTTYAAKIAREQGATLSAEPQAIALSYDKTACNRHLAAAVIPVPTPLPTVADFAAFMDQLSEVPGRRAFVKLRHGAGAAGTLAVVRGPGGALVAYTALRLDGDRLRAGATVERLTDHRHIARIAAALWPLGIHAEQWIAKAGVDGRSADLRLVCTRSGAPFGVLRMSRSPITNLHLQADRAPADRLFGLMAPDAVEAVHDSCARVMRQIPGAGMLGIDVAVHADLTRHSVLEVNAFGDHIRSVRINGETPQDRQLRELSEEMADAA